MSRAIVDEETYAAASRQRNASADLADRLDYAGQVPGRQYILLNGEESTLMTAAQLQEVLFDMVTNNRSTHFTVTEGDGMTLVRVTRGVQG